MNAICSTHTVVPSIYISYIIKFVSLLLSLYLNAVRILHDMSTKTDIVSWWQRSGVPYSDKISLISAQFILSPIRSYECKLLFPKKYDNFDDQGLLLRCPQTVSKLIKACRWILVMVGWPHRFASRFSSINPGGCQLLQKNNSSNKAFFHSHSEWHWWVLYF